MCKRWKLWVAGIALGQLLVIGIDVALLWPMPTQAEALFPLFCTGMSEAEAKSVLGDGCEGGEFCACAKMYARSFEDRSLLLVILREHKDGTFTVSFAEVISPAPVSPLTRLRHILARLIPALGE
jgi:hypothetical protein